jgi:hypothetical protein
MECRDVLKEWAAMMQQRFSELLAISGDIYTGQEDIY